MEHLVTSSQQLSKVLKGIRGELGLTQEQLGARIGFPQKEVSHMKHRVHKTRVERLFQLMSALDCEMVIRPRPLPEDSEW